MEMDCWCRCGRCGERARRPGRAGCVQAGRGAQGRDAAARHRQRRRLVGGAGVRAGQDRRRARAGDRLHRERARGQLGDPAHDRSLREPRLQHHHRHFVGLRRRLSRGCGQVSRGGLHELRRRDQQRREPGELLRAQLPGLVSGGDRRRPPDAVEEGGRHRRLSAGGGELGPERLPARGAVGRPRDRDGRRLRQHLVRPGEGDPGGRGACWSRGWTFWGPT